MCAINGFNFKDEKLIRKMDSETIHRGPDGSGIWTDEHVSFGHNRLSIIDPDARSNQPMHDSAHRYAITYNGELYNFRELRAEISEYSFKTQSDTEVILAAYQKWGEDCVKHFNGIFAFAIWDTQERTLFLARDHVGVKPLYYSYDGKKFIFSSEIKAILVHDIARRLNKEAFEHYLRVLYVPEPLTMFEGIYKLPPAHQARLKEGKLSVESYWNPDKNEKIWLPKEELKEKVRSTVISATRRQLVSDKPVGLYLSGGIDSSVVLHSAVEAHPRIDTFSVGFTLRKEEDRKKFNSDFLLARKTAYHYGTRHHEVFVVPQEVIELFEKAVWHLDEPISNPTIIAQLKLAGLAKEKVDVVLGGDGGDELFGGYNRYRLSLISSYYRYIPSFVREIMSKRHDKFRKLNIPPGVDRFALFMFQKNNLLRQVVAPEYISDITKRFFEKKYFSDISGIFEEKFMSVDRRSWLPDESLARTDKMAMAEGLEARVPLLDREVVELASKISLSYKISPFDTKIILRDAFRKDLPSFLFREPKRGWFSPAAKWLRHEHIASYAREVLSPGYYPPTKNLFLWDKVGEMLEKHIAHEGYNLTMIWAILTFQVWAKKFGVQIE